MPTSKLLTRDKSVIEDLTRSGFMANEEQIEALARYNLHSIAGSDTVRGIYLKTVIVGVQKEIEASTVESEPEVVLAAVHGRYYKAVMRAVTPKNLADSAELPKDERKARSLERNRRGNFARSAKSTVLSFIKAGGDIMQLNASNITKSELTAFSLAMRSTVVAQAPLGLRTAGALDRLEQLVRQLADEDKIAAIELVQVALNRLTEFMGELGIPHTSRSDEAVREQRLLKLPAGNFWPVTHTH